MNEPTKPRTATFTEDEFSAALRRAMRSTELNCCNSLEELLKSAGEHRAAAIVAKFREGMPSQ